MASDSPEYTVGWICAIEIELLAATLSLEEEHEPVFSQAANDNNVYTFGRIGLHNVVVASLPMGEYGTASAATAAKDMLRSFPSVRVGLMVGIGGGCPSAKNDIRLGDVVVSSPRDGYSGVFQYDYGKTIQGQKFESTRHLDQPPTMVRGAATKLYARHEMNGNNIAETIDKMLTIRPRLQKKFRKPPVSSDRLYKSDVVHPPTVSQGVSAAVCAEVCGTDVVPREPRGPDVDEFVVHYGLIASGNQLIKDATMRDKLAQERDVLCFEMEAAGLMNHFPCVVIRGICDYSDSHKNTEWQPYAALSAATYARQLLSLIAPKEVSEQELLNKLADLTSVASDIHVVDADNEPDVVILEDNTPPAPKSPPIPEKRMFQERPVIMERPHSPDRSFHSGGALPSERSFHLDRAPPSEWSFNSERPRSSERSFHSQRPPPSEWSIHSETPRSSQRSFHSQRHHSPERSFHSERHHHSDRSFHSDRSSHTEKRSTQRMPSPRPPPLGHPEPPSTKIMLQIMGRGTKYWAQGMMSETGVWMRRTGDSTRMWAKGMRMASMSLLGRAYMRVHRVAEWFRRLRS